MCAEQSRRGMLHMLKPIVRLLEQCSACQPLMGSQCPECRHERRVRELDQRDALPVPQFGPDPSHPEQADAAPAAAQATALHNMQGAVAAVNHTGNSGANGRRSIGRVGADGDECGDGRDSGSPSLPSYDTSQEDEQPHVMSMEAACSSQCYDSSQAMSSHSMEAATGCRPGACTPSDQAVTGRYEAGRENAAVNASTTAWMKYAICRWQA